MADAPHSLSPFTNAIDDNLEEISHWLSYLLRRADREIARRFAAQFERNESPPVTHAVLTLISHTPGLYQREIAQRLGLDNSNAARLIRSLEDDGWLVRRHAAKDRRRLGVYLTPQGVQELAKHKRDMRVFERQLAAEFTQEELATLIGLLARLQRHH